MKIQPIENKPVFKPKERDLSDVMPGYKIYEYLLVLNPHEALREKIMQVKQYFFDTYKNSTAIYSKPCYPGEFCTVRHDGRTVAEQAGSGSDGLFAY